MLTEANKTKRELSDVLIWVLDEGERALIEVDARIDEPGLRLPSVDVEAADREVLEVALAEWIDAHPTVQHELDALSDRIRTVGARTAARELEEQPHLIDFLRLTLEVFVRRYPSAASFEQDYERHEETGDSNPLEVWEGLRRVLIQFRRRIS